MDFSLPFSFENKLVNIKTVELQLLMLIGHQNGMCCCLE